ncbi:conserved Plasmodium protein, unknown function [Plasmodium knowlesi strain H]|uniref:Uncharacterized protein n=3 Tax=Plasmodium knowlesi TaxID=5850 RepID=A0A5E7WW11_PLAKH|nr:conserved protein, unknown function [Plasmodium knowlesi strain H]OTN68515.1 Uncharacterized protein PKNOH_S02298700 [Plasmodium knowlesi]CAA9986492.1 conserved protein, unknown function [Plasmodium knowlesi strain H]SBO24251.1 conserved Plasmodium protein, unknown function [Plasmodium knowlesi strain H]SBO29739.1 conserved Plasmodium protein, unknown function [Plasmodium knowlesi strain H]VVS75966.1 conserved protein, unknown function [Plasmodium knowlesi strain H]
MNNFRKGIFFCFFKSENCFSFCDGRSRANVQFVGRNVGGDFWRKCVRQFAVGRGEGVVTRLRRSCKRRSSKRFGSPGEVTSRGSAHFFSSVGGEKTNETDLGGQQQGKSADGDEIADVKCGVNVRSNGSSHDEEEGQRESQSDLQKGEDNVDQEDVDRDDVDRDDVDQYAKSFYEIYDDQGDTQDCPHELRRFIIKEHMDVKIKIKCSSPRNLNKRDVQNVIGEMFEGGEEIDSGNDMADSGNEKVQDDAEIYYLNSNFKNFNYPDRNVLWPNPLVYNHRLQPFLLERKEDEDSNTFDMNKKYIEVNKRRLQNLWSYSSSYGVDWNTLDALYLKFKNEKEEHLKKWEEHKNNIMIYASRVAKRKLINSRKKLLDNLGIDYSNNVYANYEDTGQVQETYMEDDQEVEYNLLFPRSVFRKWTRTLYFYWKDRYMHYYEDTLCDYLKGEVVDLQLLREQNERNLHLSGKKMMREHSFSLRPVKGSNLYVTRYIPKGKRRVRTNADQFDLTGVGENIYNTAQKEK